MAAVVAPTGTEDLAVKRHPNVLLDMDAIVLTYFCQEHVLVAYIRAVCSSQDFLHRRNETSGLAFRISRMMLACAHMTCVDGGSDEAPAASFQALRSQAAICSCLIMTERHSSTRNHLECSDHQPYDGLIRVLLFCESQPSSARAICIGMRKDLEFGKGADSFIRHRIIKATGSIKPKWRVGQQVHPIRSCNRGPGTRSF